MTQMVKMFTIKTPSNFPFKTRKMASNPSIVIVKNDAILSDTLFFLKKNKKPAEKLQKPINNVVKSIKSSPFIFYPPKNFPQIKVQFSENRLSQDKLFVKFAVLLYDIVMVDVEKIKPQIKKLAEKYGLSLVMLFGSQITGKTHKESDFDIAYLSDKKLSFEDEGRMIIDLASIIGARDERLVNLCNVKEAGALLLKEIFDQHQVLFCADQNIYDSYKIFAVKNFLESRQLFDLRDYLIGKYFANHAK